MADPLENHHLNTCMYGKWSHQSSIFPVSTFEVAKNIWVISEASGYSWSTAFDILRDYWINSFANIFVGHIGNVELSAVAISLSVIAKFSFGFLVRFPLVFGFLMS